KGKPNDATLRDLFEKYKDQEPSPERDRPGFKEPRRIALEYVSAKIDLPLVRKRAEGLEAALREVRQRFALMNAYAGGGDVAAWATQAAVPVAFALPLIAAYEERVHRTKPDPLTWISPPFSSAPELRLLDAPPYSNMVHERTLLTLGSVTTG